MTVRRWAPAALLTFAFAFAVAATSLAAQPEAEKKPSEPFYRKYLVPGNRLDDRILEQDARVHANPDDASLRNDLGNLLAARRFPHEAAEQYELAAKLDKSNFIALYNLGLLRETEGKAAQAMQAYRRAIERKAGFPPAHFRLGRLYEKAQRSQDAVAEYALSMRIDPAMRDPKRNPLVIDSELIYQASLTNYARDVASASMAKESMYVEESRFRAVPVDRPVSSQEAAGEDAESGTEPRQIGVNDAAGATAEPGTGRRAGTRPGSQESVGGPMVGRPRTSPSATRRPVPRGGAPLVAAPTSSSAPAPPPPSAEVTPAPGPAEPEPPPESLPEPTPATPIEEEPS